MQAESGRPVDPLTLACPTCHAPPAAPCHGSGGAPWTRYHVARVRAAERAARPARVPVERPKATRGPGRPPVSERRVRMTVFVEPATDRRFAGLAGRRRAAGLLDEESKKKTCLEK